MSTTKKILIGIAAVILFFQLPFFGPKKNQSTADTHIDITDKYQVPMNVQMILYNACYDCHSNYTENYPWYSNIQPVSWWMYDHIVEAKKELNFSEFADYSPKRALKKFKEIKREMDHGSMPLKSYLIMHKKAKLTAKEIQNVMDWADNMQDTLKAQYPELK